jgi:hypothetical protein
MTSTFTQVQNFIIDYLDNGFDMYDGEQDPITAGDVETFCGYASFEDNMKEIADAVEDYSLMKDVAKAVNEHFNLI